MSRDITSLPPVSADERISYGVEAPQFFDVWTPHDRPIRGAVVMIHGGFWRARYDLAHASHLCRGLAKNGIAVASLEYRRVGNPGGGWPGSYHDVVAGFHAAQDFLKRQPVVVGHSAGGHLALRLAADTDAMRGVVALAPVASLQTAYEMNLSHGAVVEFLGGSPSSLPTNYEDACPLRHASKVIRALIHGTDDDIVPIAMSREFVQARRNDRPEPHLVELKGTGHFDLIDPESNAFATVLKAIVEMIDAPPKLSQRD
jgi:acetyl esterase/lipase